MNPQAIIAQVAESQLGIHETSPNQGPGIGKYWLATTYSNGEEDRQPWCSAFGSWCVREADRRSDLLAFPNPPRFPAVAQWLPWSRENGCQIFTFSDLNYVPQAGDLLPLLPHLSHFAIIVKDGWQMGFKAATVEGNSNNDGSRDGKEVVRHLRARSQYPDASVIRVPAVAQIDVPRLATVKLAQMRNALDIELNKRAVEAAALIS